MDKYSQLTTKYSYIMQPLKSTIDELLSKCKIEIEDGKDNNIYNDFNEYLNSIENIENISNNEAHTILNELLSKSEIYGINKNLLKKPTSRSNNIKKLLTSNLKDITQINNNNIQEYYKKYESYKVGQYECVIDKLLQNTNNLHNKLKGSSLSKSLQDKINDNMMNTLSKKLLNTLNSDISDNKLQQLNKLHIEYLNEPNNNTFKKLLELMQKQGIDTSFWKNKIENDENINMQDLFNHAFSTYKKEIEKENSNKIFETMEQQYEALLKKLYEYINSLEEIFKQLKKMGKIGNFFEESFEVMAEDIWYGKQSGSIHIKSLELIKQYASLMENNKEIQNICDIIGRLEQELLSISREKIQIVETYENLVPVKHFKEEISGITLGRDISSLVPSEYSIMFDEDMDILFNLKYVENRLMMFENQSYVSHSESRDFEEEIEKEDKKESEKGPVILCIDTSGSMRGMPEYIAKAMSLYIVTQAKKSDRDCFLINFSTNIQTLDFQKGKNFSALMDFLQMSFNGGTDAMPALQEAVKTLQRDDYSKADVLMISDFIYPYIHEDLLDKIKTEQERGTKFYGLSITFGEVAYKTHDYFDAFWYYNVYNNTISKIGSIIDEFQEIIK